MQYRHLVPLACVFWSVTAVSAQVPRPTEPPGVTVPREDRVVTAPPFTWTPSTDRAPWIAEGALMAGFDKMDYGARFAEGALLAGFDKIDFDAGFAEGALMAGFDKLNFDASFAEAAWAGWAQDAAPRRQTWYQEDPADSLFRAAHALFSRQEYRAAAQRFAEVRSRFPNTRYFCDAAYYEAFSRYRLGMPAELRSAYTVLDGLGDRCATAARRADVPELQARVDAALARHGDSAASERVRRAASRGENVCDREERTVRTAALGALAEMDPQAADPVLRTVLNLKDECSIPVRRQALALVARRNDAQAVALLAQSARNDPDRETRAEAVRVLARTPNDAAVSALEELLRTSTDERVQATAADAMARSDHPRAQGAIRALIERTDVAEKVRLSAINALAPRPNVSHEYWRSLYTKLSSDDLRRAVVAALARSDAPEAQQFLLSIARNPAEPAAVRSYVISRVRNTAPISELYQVLQAADSRSIRLSIVNGLVARKEPEATTRLIDIAKTSTDPEVRNAAIRALGRSPRKEDPAVIKALAEIVAGGGL